MELDLRRSLRILRKRRWWALGVVAVCLAAFAAFTITATPVYEAEAQLFVGQRQIAATEVAQGQTITQLSFQLLKSYARILTTRPIAEQAVEQQGLPLSPEELSDEIKADPILDTQIIRLRYRSTDASLAQRTVNALADAFVGEVQKIETPTAAGQEPAVKVSIVEPALRPDEPVSPDPVRNMALALILGLVAGPTLAFLVEQMDTSVKGRDDVEDGMGLPVLAAVPQIETKGAAVYLERDTLSAGAEAFRKLRTAVQFLGVEKKLRTILVTSPFPQEGKTTTSLNLAAAFAQAGMRTLIIEADLRRPMLHRLFPVDGQRGLTGALMERVEFRAALQTTPMKGLYVMPAGALPPNPAELLGSQPMADLLERVQAAFDVAIVDAPPLLPVTDASVLAPRVDGVVIVARTGQTHKERLQEATELVPRVGGRLLGVVLNFIKAAGDGYGYSYYGYRAEGAFETTHVSERAGNGSHQRRPRPAAPRARSTQARDVT